MLNTVILLTSGLTVTAAHYALFWRLRSLTGDGLIRTVALGTFFTGCQAFEYAHAPFSINDGIYGSCFFMMTGFHGLHVIFGTVWLFVIILRHYYYHFTPKNHFAFEAAI